MLSRIIRKHFSVAAQEASQQVAVDMRMALIKASLLHVNKFGWNQKAIQAGCNDLNLSSASHGILSNGGYDLVDYMMTEWNQQTAQKLKELAHQDMKIHEKVALGVKTRLSLEIPYVNTWNEAMALGILPRNVSKTTAHLWRLVDDIWFISGDRSADLNFYSKRSLLLGVYASTELFMLTDKSKNFIETWKFLDRRIDEAVGAGMEFHKLKDITFAAGKGFLDMTTLLKGFPSKVENSIEDIKREFGNSNNKQQ